MSRSGSAVFLSVTMSLWGAIASSEELGITADPVLSPYPWLAVETDSSKSLAWGDWGGDGDLDLAVGNTRAGRGAVRSVSR